MPANLARPLVLGGPRLNCRCENGKYCCGGDDNGNDALSPGKIEAPQTLAPWIERDVRLKTPSRGPGPVRLWTWQVEIPDASRVTGASACLRGRGSASRRPSRKVA